MKIVKYLFFLILLIFIGSAIYFGTQNGNFSIENTREINAPLPVVFDKVNQLESWESWGPWDAAGDAHFSKAEKTSGEGASVSWSGKNKGDVVTTRVIPEKEIEQILTYHSFFGEREATVIWNFEPMDDGTLVTWTLNGSHNLMDKIYLAVSRKDFEKEWRNRKDLSLTSLERVVKEDMEQFAIHTDGITHYGGGYYMFVSSASKQSEMHHKVIPMLDRVKTFMEENNIRVSGDPFLINNEIDEANKNIIFSAAYPVRDQVITPESSPVIAGFFEPVSAVKVTLKGAYKHIPEAYSDARAFIRENGYTEDFSRKTFEVFSISEKDTPNPAQWTTEIYVPIRQQETETPESL